MMTMEYRAQTRPVALRAADCGILIFSAGRARSPSPAITRLCKKNTA